MRPVAGALSDPVWWGALGLLLVNDHVLKRIVETGSPAAMITGKLSDLAGLVVAPMLASALAQRVVGARWAAHAAFAGVVAFFCALKLSEAFAAGWVSLWGALGVAHKVVADPTDLLALPAAYFAYARAGKHASHDVTHASHERKEGSLVQRAAVVLGGFSCLATSFDWDYAPVPPAARNATQSELSVGVQHYSMNLDCGQPVNVSAFDVVRVVSLGPGEWVSLSNPSASQDGGGTASSCGAARISAPEMAAVTVRWDLRGIDRTGSQDAKHIVAAGTVYLEQFGAEVRLSVGEGVTRIEAPQ